MGGETALIVVVAALCVLFSLKLVLSHLEREGDARRETQLEKTRQYVHRDLAVARAESGAFDAFPLPPEPAAGSSDGIDGLIGAVLQNPDLLKQVGGLLGGSGGSAAKAAGFHPDTAADPTKAGGA